MVSVAVLGSAVDALGFEDQLARQVAEQRHALAALILILVSVVSRLPASLLFLASALGAAGAGGARAG